MQQKMSFSKWVAARKDLATIRHRAHLAGLVNLCEMLEMVENSLTVDECPIVAAIELEFLASHLRRCPSIKKAMRDLSKRLSIYPTAEVVPLH